MIAIALALFAAQASPLWIIGRIDGTPTGFALEPGRYRQYQNDPVYIVGQSTSKDWPYVLPGPIDAWGGSRIHSARIVFALDRKPTGTSDLLTVRFKDTQAQFPPRLELNLNGKTLGTWQSPAGSGDDVVEGKSNQGKPSTWSIPIKSSLLVKGNNTLTLSSRSGSWCLFQSIQMSDGNGVGLTSVLPEISIAALPQRQVVLHTRSGNRQPVEFEVVNIGPPVRAKLTIAGQSTISVNLETGAQTVRGQIPPPTSAVRLPVELATTSTSKKFLVQVERIRPWIVYLLPHSHLDIGYTDVQTHVAAMHRRNLFDAISVSRESLRAPLDSRYRFTMEGTWILDNLLHDGSAAERRLVAEAFKSVTMTTSANYCNELTGLMRPEELMRGYGYATRLASWLGHSLRTATQTDVPGITWGAVDAMCESGISNLVLMPNPSDRIGGVLREWQDKPFFWKSPSGKSTVFVWETTSYGTAHALRHFNGDRSRVFRTSNPTQNFIEGYVFDRLNQLAHQNYPYDILGLPWSGTDNYPVDGDVSAAATEWNRTYAIPNVVVSTVDQACDEFVRRYRSTIPVVSGDLTPYWEDGAGSSARETAMNRASADRLLQAEALCAMSPRGRNYDSKGFWEGWKNVLLYSEHTWGAYNSVSEPDSDFVRKQWEIKKGFAEAAQTTSTRLLDSQTQFHSRTLSVFNTHSWPVTGLVTLSKAQSGAGDRVIDTGGHQVPSQRLHSGQLAFLVRDIPPLSGRDFRIVPGLPFSTGGVKAAYGQIESIEWRIRFDSKTFGIRNLYSKVQHHEFAGTSSSFGAYQYLAGDDTSKIQGVTYDRFEVVDSGPLVARIRLSGHAPGVRSFSQEIQVVAGLDRVEFDNRMDKLAIRTKESVHFPFSFSVPNGQIRIHAPGAIIRPDKDQLPGSNKNWFTTQYFADVSNDYSGITWCSLDAPLLEVGGITAHMLDGGFRPDQWLLQIGSTQTLVSWAMNNHWYTNYRADQSGHHSFRFVLGPHGPYNAGQAYRFGVEAAQPLLVTSRPAVDPLFTVSDPNVVVTALKPTEDGKGIFVRLWNTDRFQHPVHLKWRPGVSVKLYLSDSSESPKAVVPPTLTLSPLQFLSLRANLSQPN